jgi:prevent-host-death family protein
MFKMDAIHPVSDFSRKPAEHIKRLKKTGLPEILTVNGKAEIVIQDAKAYEKMVELLDSLEKIARAAKSHDEGKGIPVNEFFKEFGKKHGLKRDSVQD